MEQIDKEEKKEMTRRADQRALAEQALTNAAAILNEFDQLGARFDEQLFDIAERAADNARRLFKSAQAYVSAKKDEVVQLFKRCQQVSAPASNCVVLFRGLLTKSEIY